VQKSGLVDQAILGNLDNPYTIIKEINPDIIALGYDQNSFTANLSLELKKAHLYPTVLRLKPYKPEIYHSSLLPQKTKIKQK